jgi:riboflavin synthase
MFTGIVKKIGVIEFFDLESRILGIKSSYKKLTLGESISCSGVCLTVSEMKKDVFFCNLSSETMSKTNLNKRKIGDKLNIERSLKIGDDLSGHLVFGHVDGISPLKEIVDDENSKILKFSTTRKLLRYLTEKCSISIDGISLTVNKTFQDSFSVSVIPYTWMNTNLKYSKIGDDFNIEIDMLARYVFKALKK